MPPPGATGVMTVPSTEHYQQFTEYNQPTNKQYNSHQRATGASDYQSIAADSNRYSLTNGSLSQGSSNIAVGTNRMSSDNSNGQLLDGDLVRKQGSGIQSISRHIPGSSGDDGSSIGTHGNGSIFGPVVNGENAPMSSSQPPSLVNSNSQPGTCSTTPGTSGFLTTPSVSQSQSTKYSSPHTLVTSQTPTTVSNSPPFQPSTLRQRHNLQVPAASSKNRASTGSITDAAVASGRFSPTTAGTPRRASISLGRRGTRSMDNYMDEIPPDEDAAKAAEAIIAKRASKRRRKEEEEDDKVLVGTKVDINHANWITAYNMLTGIRFVVCNTFFLV